MLGGEEGGGKTICPEEKNPADLMNQKLTQAEAELHSLQDLNGWPPPSARTQDHRAPSVLQTAGDEM